MEYANLDGAGIVGVFAVFADKVTPAGSVRTAG
jgi:hypothetical protein